jgi:hypothetical protein
MHLLFGVQDPKPHRAEGPCVRVSLCVDTGKNRKAQLMNAEIRMTLLYGPNKAQATACRMPWYPSCR